MSIPARRALAAAFVFLVASNAQVRAQAPVPRRLEPDSAAVVVLPVALYNSQANQQEPTDSARATAATVVLEARLSELLGASAIMGPRVRAALGSPGADRVRGDQACNVIVACARAVARALHGPWVVMAKVSKTSNLIWLFTGQLIHTSSGKILLDDSTELKGEPDRMARAGARIFAERVARAVRSGGVVTDFPHGEPQ